MENIRNTAQIKQNNMNSVRESLFSGETLTKKDISERTGLSLATCTVILGELIGKKQVLELEFAEPKGGRPARRFCLNPDWGHILCIYTDNNFEERGVSCRVYDMSGNILHDTDKEVSSIGAGSFRTIISEMISVFPKIRMIGLGIAGICGDNDVVEACDHHELIGLNLKKILEDEFGVSVFVANDMYFTSYGFYLKEPKNKPFSVSVSLWPENHCAGAGSVVDGHILLGSTRFAGEIANLPYDLSYEEQLERLMNKHDILPMVGMYLTCTVVMINPDVVYITGKSAGELDMESLKTWCKKYIPENHLPEIRIQTDIRDEYMTGIFGLSRMKMDF